MNQIEAAIKAIAKDIESCDACSLLPGVSDIPVFPRGNVHARCMLVGEGPGEQEELQRKPFVGASGALLESVLKSFGFNPDADFYITNVVKHRAFELLANGKKKNKPPSARHIETEREFLVREIKAIKPKLIVALGAKAAQWFLGKGFKLTQEHGKLFTWQDITVLPTYHPSAILRARMVGAGDERRREFERDLSKIAEIIAPSNAA